MNFNKPQTSMIQVKKKVLLIDMWNVMIAMNATTYIEDHNTYPAGMYIGTLNQLRTFVDRLKPDHVICVFDGPEAGERRRQLYPDYKGGKRVKERVSKVQIMEGEDNIVFGVEGAFQNQIIKLFDFLKLLPVTNIIIPYCEADDAITYLALKNKDDFNCQIISNDKDYLQLVQDGISVYRWKEKKLYDEKLFSETFNIRAKNYIFQKVLLGDTSDKVEGIKGIGKKTFSSLEKELTDKVYNNIEEFSLMLENRDKTLFNNRENNSFEKALEQKETMELCYKIMKLDESCLMEEQIDILSMQMEEQKDKQIARLTLTIKISKNPFNKLYAGFDVTNWVRPFYFLKNNLEIKY